MPEFYEVWPQTQSWRTRRVFGRPWQDLIFALGEVVFLFSLVPMLFDSKTHVNGASAFATAVMLYLFCVVQTSYRNYITLALSFVTATVWVLLGLGVHLG